MACSCIPPDVFVGEYTRARRTFKDAAGRKAYRKLDTFNATMLKRDDVSSNRHHALACCLSMIFSEKPVSTFRDHALERRWCKASPPLQS
jgi:hypothetical protein